MIQLSINENPYTPEELVKQALLSVEVNRYPDELYRQLKTDLSAFLNTKMPQPASNLKPEQFVFGNGSDELISLCMQSLLKKGDTVICATPCFSEYVKAAENYGLQFCGVPMDASLTIPVDKLLARANEVEAKMLIICSPDNPSGQMLPEASLNKLLAGFEGLILLDEAYVEFSASPFATLGQIERNPRLIILRTFSKAFGLAGLRIGYMIAQPEISAVVDRFRHPYNVNAPAVAVASAILNAPELSLSLIEAILSERRRLEKCLRILVEKVYPSETNFFLIRDSRHQMIYSSLLNAGILVRRFDQPALADCLRLSVGTPGENDLLIGILSECCKEAV